MLNDAPKFPSSYLRASDLQGKTSNLFDDAAIEWLLRNRYKNGLSPYVKKVNGCLYVHWQGFCEWFERHSD